MNPEIEALAARVDHVLAVVAGLQAQIDHRQSFIDALNENIARLRTQIDAQRIVDSIAGLGSSADGIREQMAAMLAEYDKGTSARVNAVLRDNDRRGR